MNWYLRNYGEPPILPSSYKLIGSVPPLCPGSGKICCIKAETDEFGSPIIDEYLLRKMVESLNNNVDIPYCVLLRFTN